jgi:hypothetical protein
MRKLTLVPAIMAATLLLAACGGQSTASTLAATSTAGEAAGGDHSAEGGHDGDADEHYGIPDVTWDASAEKAVQDTAAKVMGLFARPDVPETTWFADLSPYLAPEYAEDAKYIDPARVPMRKITDGPAISRESGDPLTVTATFSTDAGRWRMLLHRSGQQQPWLVTAISPQDPA